MFEGVSCQSIFLKSLRRANRFLAEKIQDKDVLKLVLSFLYLGEGAKWKSHRGDPRTIGKPTKNKNYKRVCVITGASTKVQLELETIPKIVLEALHSTELWRKLQNPMTHASHLGL